MKRLFLALCLLLVAVPCRAQVFLEIGNTPVLGAQWEKPSFALGLGTSVNWSTVHTGVFPSGETTKLSFVTLSPVLTGQFFLNRDSKARSFLELRLSKGVPIFSSGAGTEEQLSDDWSFAAGAGLRSAVAERLNLGGAADYWVTLRTVDTRPNDLYSATTFRAFFQYRL